MEHSLNTEDGRLCLFAVVDMAHALDLSAGTVSNCIIGLMGDGYVEKYRCHACYRILYVGN